MSITISDIIEELDKIEEDLDSMQHIPDDKINAIKSALDNVIQELEECSVEYGEEYLDDDEDDEDDDY